MLPVVHPLLLAALRDGLVAADRLPSGLPPWALPNAVRGGHLVRFQPGVYGRPDADPVRAAGLYIDGRGAVSHSSALAIWGLCERPPTIHITVPPGCRLRPSGLAIHLRTSLTLGPPDILRRNGVPVTSLDDTLVAAWPQLEAEVQIAALLRAVNERMTLPERIASAVARAKRVADRATLVRLVTQLTAGCRSYLELFGLQGILVVRFSYRRIVADPEGVRRQVLDILRPRR